MSGKPAARLTDPTDCSLPGHGTNPITSGSSNVLFDGLPAAREGDTTDCGGTLVTGFSSSVLINGKSAAVVGSTASHGNTVIAGSGTVIIGNTHTPAAFEPPSPLVIPGTFNRVFAFKTTSGKTVEGLRYQVISESGIEDVGTANLGKAKCFSTRQKPEFFTVFVASE
jgi:uncharacterized Zn-binding protein involved in type VI secretion